MNLSYVKFGIRRKLTHFKWRYMLAKPSPLSTEEARRTLWQFYPKEKPIFVQKNLVSSDIDLHIIVPVYNVQDYLEECIDSILNQKTTYSYHITLVNDGSTDASQDVLDRYAQLENVTVIVKENGGVSSARNTALKHILGKYVMFVDSDDILTEHTVQTLLKIAFENNAGIVEGSHQLLNEKGRGESFIHGTETERSSYKVLFGFPWGKVIRSDLLREFCFPEDYLFEDTVMSTLLHPSCENIYTSPEIIYLYRENQSGISKSSVLSRHGIDTFWMMKYCLEERVERGQVMGGYDLDKYLFALYRNWGRTSQMPDEVQESIFVLSCDLLDRYFETQMARYSGAYSCLLRTAQSRSYKAFAVMVRHWWMF